MLTLDTPVVTPAHVLRLPQDPQGARWWLLQTSSHRERRLAAALAERGGSPVLITTTALVSRYNGAGRKFQERKEVLLFPTYVFANGTADQVYDARQNQPAQIIEVRNQSRTAEQIARTIELAASVECLTTEKLMPGMAVEVIAGPFMGMQGTVRECRPGVVFFDVNMMGRAVPMEIEPEFIERL